MLRLSVLTGTCQSQARVLILEEGVKWVLLIVWKNNNNYTILLGSGQKSLAMEVAGPRTKCAIIILPRGHVVRLQKNIYIRTCKPGLAQQWWKCFFLQWTSINGQMHSELECCDRHRVLSFPWKPRLREQPEEQPEDAAESCEMLDVTIVTLMGSQQLCLPAGDLTGQCFIPN